MTATPKRSSDTKVLGCLGGCFGLVVVILLVVFGTLYYSLKFGRFAAAPRTDTVAHLGGEPALLLRIAPDAPTAFTPAMLDAAGASTYNGGIFRMFRPYEGTVVVSIPPGGAGAEIAGALSMPRGAAFLKNYATALRPELEGRGFKITAMNVEGEESGVFSIFGDVNLPKEAGPLRAEAWPAPLEGAAPALEKSHFVEFYFDNRNGDGALAATAIAQYGGEGGEESRDTGDPIAMSLLSQVRIIKGLRFVKMAWGAIDFSPSGDLNVTTRIAAKDEVCAMFLMAGLGNAPAEMKKVLQEAKLAMSGDFVRSGDSIVGTFTFHGVTAWMRDWMNEYNEEYQKSSPNWVEQLMQP
nr:hypothetical protein [uncultured bacterium]